jgi:hypothetical protein
MANPGTEVRPEIQTRDLMVLTSVAKVTSSLFGPDILLSTRSVVSEVTPKKYYVFRLKMASEGRNM